MTKRGIIKDGMRFLGTKLYHLLDACYVPLDKRFVRRAKNIRLIPSEDSRRGGKRAYSEWAHVIGIFQTLMYLHLDKNDDNLVLDVGCGTGLLGIACEPFLGKTGRYVGIDVVQGDIEFCRSHYPSPSFSFLHLDTDNPAYAPYQNVDKVRWSVESASFDLVAALSVWTHLNEQDALFYFGEVDRVLKVGGKAIITFFVLDEAYKRNLDSRSGATSRYHTHRQDRYIFDQPAYDSDAWLCPQWVQVPENAIGVTEEGLDRLLVNTDLQIAAHYPGNWKEMPGVFFQDILVFQKA